MWKLSLPFFLVLTGAMAQYKAEPVGPPPEDVPEPFAAVMQKDGHRILSGDGKALFEIWFRNDMPKAAAAEESASLAIPHGAMLGVIRFVTNGADRRGQTIKPGVYTLRYSLFPINGDHQGVAPQRDFLVLLRAADDKDPNATPSYKSLMPVSMKATGTPHPGVLSIWKAEAGTAPGFAKEGEHDWVLNTKIGDTPVAVILIGKAEG